LSTQADIAHLLRRVGFGPFPGQVDALVPGGTAAALNSVLNATPPALPAPPNLTGSGAGPDPVEWWLQRMRDPAVGLAEKMVWFWHGHLVSAQSKVNHWDFMWTQNLLFRQDALGNFRTLMQAITIDAAMLRYLDGDPSEIVAPNENYSRELMELFTLGFGTFTEPDVKAGAKALTGWNVAESGAVTFDPSTANTTPVTFLGQSVVHATDAVNTVCNNPNMAPYITTKLYKYFHGVAPSSATSANLVNVFTTNNLELRPLVTAILQDPLFFDATRRLNRPRLPVEWVSAAGAVYGTSDYNAESDRADNMGMLPYYPPNVAGWPTGNRWLSASQALIRADVGTQVPVIPAIQTAANPVAAALAYCSMYEVTSKTQTAITTAVAQVSGSSAKAQMALGLAVSSPEFALS
jgi:uncharacterized protein (DUF1800 family)